MFGPEKWLDNVEGLGGRWWLRLMASEEEEGRKNELQPKSLQLGKLLMDADWSPPDNVGQDQSE